MCHHPVLAPGNGFIHKIIPEGGMEKRGLIDAGLMTCAGYQPGSYSYAAMGKAITALNERKKAREGIPSSTTFGLQRSVDACSVRPGIPARVG